MERTAKLQVPVEPEELKALKLYTAQNGVSMAELVRLAIDVEYGDRLREIVKHFAPTVSVNTEKHPQ